MLSISKESLAPRMYEGLREFHRYNFAGTCSRIGFLLVSV